MKQVVASCIFLFMSVFLVQQIHAQDTEDKPVKDFQLSVFPFVGTDGSDVVNNRYKVSFNLFAGVTGGIEGFEAAGFMNINRGMMEGFQLSGFGNVNSENMRGFQWAGFINVVNGAAEGLNFAGFMNTIRGDHEGIKGAGFMNVTGGNSRSVSGAGFMNVTGGSLQGLAGAGFMNVTGGDFDGLQGAGFINVVRGNATGLAGAGFANVAAGSVQGIQAAGFMNVAGNIQGVQASGFLNVSGETEGLQIGFINYSDTISGIPIGFLSIVKRGGLRQIELSTSDIVSFNASFKIGVEQFYNIFSFGHQPFFTNSFSATGYGIGTRIGLSQKSLLTLEGHSYQIHPESKFWNNKRNTLNELRTLYTFKVGENLELFGGLVLYQHIFRATDDQTLDDLQISSWNFYESDRNENRSQWWVGARAGVTFAIR